MKRGSGQVNREPDAVECVRAEVVVALGGERRDDACDEFAKPGYVLTEDLEYLGLGHSVALVNPRVGVGDQRQRRVAEGKLTGEDRLGVWSVP